MATSFDVLDIREAADNGNLQTIPEVFRVLKAGQLINSVVRQLQTQSVVTQVTTTATDYTWAQLGIGQPRDAFAETGTLGINLSAVGALTVADHAGTAGTGLRLSVATTAGLVQLVVSGSPYVENVAVASNAATLSNTTAAPVPAAILDVVATNATTVTNRGRKTLRIADSDYTPALGEVVWDGSTGLRLNSGDDASSLMVTLIPSGTPPAVASMLARVFGQQDR